MASCSSLLSEEQFMCSICLDVFNKPVTTQCGHNFCKACITKYWDSIDLCQCPMCKKTFDKRPELFVNTFISEMAAPFRKSVPVKAASSPDQRPAITDVSCDICTGTKLKALKSCLMCQTSYCETHLEPHLRVSHLIKHTLIDPVENLEDRMCDIHNRPLELFCRTDQMCVCQFCSNKGDHKTHDTVLLEEECGQRKAQIGKTGGEVQQMIQERLRKVQEIKLSVKISKKEKGREISDSVEVFTALVSSIQRTQAELIQVIEEKQKTAEKRAEGFIQELEQEITELKRGSTELEKLLHTEDNLRFLKTFAVLSTPPHTRDWSQIGVHSGLSTATVMRTVSQLEDTLTTDIKKLYDTELKRIRQYAVNVTLDPDTAYPWLILSKKGKQVRCGEVKQNLPDNPERFDTHTYVLGKQSFSSGRFYYEVQVKGNAMFRLGVVRESSNRNGMIEPTPQNGFWTLCGSRTLTHEMNEFDEPPQTTGVFVDYEEGQVSFFNVEAKSHLHTYTGCTFTEKLYPLLGPSNTSAPLTITRIRVCERSGVGVERVEWERRGWIFKAGLLIK